MLASDVPGLSDEDLRAQLTAQGVDVGPITVTTRKLYQRKLVRLIAGDDADSILECDSSLRISSPPDSTSDGSNDDIGCSPTVRERRAPQSISISSGSPIFRKQQMEMNCNPPLASVDLRKPVKSPFPAADAQFRRPQSNGSMTDHYLKFACFAVVVTVIVYFIINQSPENAVDLRN